MGRGALPVRRSTRRAGAQGRCARDACGPRRSGEGDARAAARPRTCRHSRPSRSPLVRARRGRRAHDHVRIREADEGCAGRGVSCGIDVHDGRGRGAQARRGRHSDGRLPGRSREARVHAEATDRDRRCDFPVQLSAQSRRPQGRAGARGGLRGRPEAGLSDAPLGPLPGGARGPGGTACGLAERRLWTGRRDRRRPRRGRAREVDHVHGLGARSAGSSESEPRASA